MCQYTEEAHDANASLSNLSHVRRHSCRVARGVRSALGVEVRTDRSGRDAPGLLTVRVTVAPLRVPAPTSLS